MPLIDHIDHLGEIRKLVEPTQLFQSQPLLKSTPLEEGELIPRTMWPDLIQAIGYDWQHPYLPPVRDQNGVGMCNASATCSAIEMTRLQTGLPPVSLSAGDLYHRICGGSDNGSTLEDGLHESSTVGVATTAFVPYLDWKHNNPASAADRPKYRVLEWTSYRGFDHLMSGGFKGFSNIVGILWYDTYTPRADGWLPRAGGRYGGHAILAYKPTMRIVNGVNQYGIWCQNSWTEEWSPGTRGHFVIPESAFTSDISGLWGVRAIVSEGGDMPQPNV